MLSRAFTAGDEGAGSSKGALSTWDALASTLPADIPAQPEMLQGGSLREYQMQVGRGWGWVGAGLGLILGLGLEVELGLGLGLGSCQHACVGRMDLIGGGCQAGDKSMLP